MKIYLAGPMRGRPQYNFPAFDEAKAALEAKGHEVISPADIDRAMGHDPSTLPADHDWTTIPEGLDLKEIVRRDVEAICQCDTMGLLPGWVMSKGAIAEFGVAQWLGLEIKEVNCAGDLSDY